LSPESGDFPLIYARVILLGKLKGVKVSDFVPSKVIEISGGSTVSSIVFFLLF